MSVHGNGLGQRMRELVNGSRMNRLVCRVILRAVDDDDAVLLGDRYQLETVVGRGSHGVVFAAYDRVLQREVALKLFGVTSERVLDEARALARVNRPNVITLFDVDRANGFTYLVMELVIGWTIRERIGMGIDWRTVVELFIAAGRGLEAAHRAGVTHGDVKPGNILVGRDDSVRVIDFELSCKLGRAETPQTGTREYLAPECWAGVSASACSDQFSFCVALWEALYGSRPWSSTRTLRCFETKPAKPRPCGDVPSQIEQALRRGLAAQPHERHPAISALVDELEDAIQREAK